MKILRNKIILSFFIFILLISTGFAQEWEITAVPEGAVPSETPPGGEEVTSSDTSHHDKTKLPVIIVATAFFLFITGLIVIISRAKSKLKEFDKQRGNITGLASKNAGLITPEDKSGK